MARGAKEERPYAGPSKEGTADFADFADRGDAAQDCRWRAKSLVRDNAMPAAMLSGPLLSVSSASSAVISTLSRGGDVSSPLPRLPTQNFLGRDVPAPPPGGE